LPSGKVIRLITAPFFVGTKMEAFYDRGENDYYMSHDLEDFIAVVEGREQLLEELADTPADLRKYLGEAANKGTSGFWRHCRDIFQATRSANSECRSLSSA